MGAKQFRAHNGEYLVAEEGHLYTTPGSSHKTKFHIEEHDGGKKVSLKTHNGHYLAVNSNKEIYVAKDHHSDEAKFELEHHGNKVALKSHHGGYIGIHDGHAKVHHERTENEMFTESD